MSSTYAELDAQWDRFIAYLDEADGIKKHQNLLGSVEKYRAQFIASQLEYPDARSAQRSF